MKKNCYLGIFEKLLLTAEFDAKMRQTLIDCAGLDWSKISPTIFGVMFQGVMDRQKRRELGAHYTSEENILKLINPLFMNDLWKEFDRVKTDPAALDQFHDKIAWLKFLDPACGCSNFLIVSYRELRRLELEVLKMKANNNQRVIDISSLLKVSVEQFYGIEIEDFSCQIARVGMWLVDHQMNLLVSEQFGQYYARLPLTQSATIVHGNALRIDWNSVVPKEELNYILGNPPYAGYSNQTKEQKSDVLAVCLDTNGKPIRRAGKIDYVAAWYYKAVQYLSGTQIRAAFVSTNSITQGEQVAAVWKPLFDAFGIHIDFAYRTFKWSNEAKGKSAVHCVIVGFSAAYNGEKVIYDGDIELAAANINPYLVDSPDVFIESRQQPLCDVPQMITGNGPTDGGHLIIEDVDLPDFLKADPLSEKYIRRFMGADEFINKKSRWCLWMVGANPNELKKCPTVIKRVESVRAFRAKSVAAATQKSAETPALFQEIRQPNTDYIVVPIVSSECRRYIPIGFLSATTIASDATLIIPNAALYHFGILTSNVHMSWMRAICGRLEMRYRYSKDIVYNNFPWPDVTDKQKAVIEKLAQAVLDARDMFPFSSLADLYDPRIMPSELLKAHQALDRAVAALYGLPANMDEPGIVAALMERYRMLVELQ